MHPLLLRATINYFSRKITGQRRTYQKVFRCLNAKNKLPYLDNYAFRFFVYPYQQCLALSIWTHERGSVRRAVQFCRFACCMFVCERPWTAILLNQRV